MASFHGYHGLPRRSSLVSNFLRSSSNARKGENFRCSITSYYLTVRKKKSSAARSSIANLWRVNNMMPCAATSRRTSIARALPPAAYLCSKRIAILVLCSTTTVAESATTLCLAVNSYDNANICSLAEEPPFWPL